MVEAATIGNGVEIGKGCIIVRFLPCLRLAFCALRLPARACFIVIVASEAPHWSRWRVQGPGTLSLLVLTAASAAQGPLVILKDFCKVADGAVVGAGTVIPSLTEWAGSPGESWRSSLPGRCIPVTLPPRQLASSVKCQSRPRKPSRVKRKTRISTSVPTRYPPRRHFRRGASVPPALFVVSLCKRASSSPILVLQTRDFVLRQREMSLLFGEMTILAFAPSPPHSCADIE